ncbi:hypothetical protein J2X16_000021 [Pelomonas aquatica]|uniref:DUF2169 domain-containing protein n=1 Tax=Pelomonas aquatica TaxID=431058 RepID=A0ABU1Z260_9BURK|nr:hypothetical protein [Pelomonas aquatica]MDR7294700.1 hypothetical protein [Pelomonas aquatica]
MPIPYRFMPFARRGLASAHANADAPQAPLAVAPRISVGLTLQAKRDGAVATAVSGNVPLRLYGPADIVGIDHRLVVRTEPKAGATDFEPNYLAAIDFDPPDFPWLLTPAAPDAAQRLRPWLVLIVVERVNELQPTLKPGAPLPSITLSAEQVASELPDLRESALWAHVQAVSDSAAASLPTELANQPALNVSRLICPRRLLPRRDYLACVVPATDGGCRRGLGQPVNGDTLGPAWSTQNPQDTELPVYFHWTFSTGPVGDIETLARRLRTPQQLGAGFAATLKAIGQRETLVDGDRLLFEGSTPSATTFEGAMVSIGFEPKPPATLPAAKLAAMLNSGAERSASGAEPAADEPTLAPPLYGEHHARRHVAQPARVSTHWLEGLSLQPRYRLAAGWGAEVVRCHQEEFMQAAWEQLGDILAAERAFSMARLARDVFKRIETRHLAKLPPDRLLALIAPARARTAVAPAASLWGRIEAATLPHELFDGAMRRLASPRRATFAKAHWKQRAQAPAPVAVQMRGIVERFANATKHVAAIDLSQFVPDGILGSESFDAVPLPGVLDELVDMKPHLGLDVHMSGHQLKALQAANVAARAHAAGLKKKPRGTQAAWREGLVTETHMARIEELLATSKTPVTGDIVSAITHATRRGTEGVLLAVKDGAITSQALRIDARSGAIKAAGAALLVHPGSRPQRAAAAATVALTRVATVPLQPLKLYGNQAVFATLPRGTLGRGDGDVQIGASKGGQFTQVPPAREPGLHTITLPPAIKDVATLTRYSAAFKTYEKTLFPTPDAALTPQPVDFALATQARAARQRLDADRTVPERLASSLSLGAQSVAFAGGAFANVFVADSLDHALVERLRYVIPRTFDRVMAYPRLPFPLSRKLEVLAPDVFLPGVGLLPDDFIMAVQTNPRFVEALMLGANHEMGREMLWRGLPTDQRGTPFQHFWQRLDDEVDIEPIHRWNAVPLGEQPLSTAMVVLLFRGQLIKRYRNLTIYAYRQTGDETKPGGAGGMVAGENLRVPVIRGQLLADIDYVGFRIAPTELNKYFFIVEEHMTEPRFGFDERVGGGQAGAGWQDVDWADLQVAGGAHLTQTQLLAQSAANGWPASPHAALVAQAAMQRPFRGYWHGSKLVAP